MLTFSTQFPVQSSCSIEDLIKAGQVWLGRSPHSKLSRQVNAAVDVPLNEPISQANESVVFSRVSDSSLEMAGVRYENTDMDSVRWVTEVVGSKGGDGFWVSVRLSVDSELPVESLFSGKKPYIMRVIMARMRGGQDGVLRVQDTPHYLSPDDLVLAAKLITAHADCVMPVVYVSAMNDDSAFVDAAKLAQWLAGMAHVVVEPSRNFSFRLMHEVFSENAYGGALAIYWPDGIGKWTFLPRGEYSDPKSMMVEVAKKVRSSLLSQRLRKSCSWSYVQELRAREKIKELRESGSDRVEDYISAFDKELEAKNEEIRRLEQEVTRLRYQPHLTKSSNTSSATSISLMGSESDLYQAERIELVLKAISMAAEQATPNSRRSVVFGDILESNQIQGQREELLAELKELLRGYRSMSSATRGSLEKIGFSISEDGKHYKLIFMGDERFTIVLPKTSSDHRSGLNAFSDLKRQLF